MSFYKLEGNRSEIVYKNKLANKNILVRYFSVPAVKKDEFIKEFNDTQKKEKTVGLIELFAVSFLGVFVGGKIFKNTLASIACSVIGGLAFAWGAVNYIGRGI